MLPISNTAAKICYRSVTCKYFLILFYFWKYLKICVRFYEMYIIGIQIFTSVYKTKIITQRVPGFLLDIHDILLLCKTFGLTIQEKR